MRKRLSVRGPTKVGPYRKALRYSAIALAVGMAILAALVLMSLTVDLGPTLRQRAEQAGSKQIQRPMHIGNLTVRLGRGDFVLEDFVIEGLTPRDRPFLRAKRIAVRMPWWTIFSRELLIEAVDMTDWQMVVETFRNGRHSFPKLTSDRPGGPKRFTTTVRVVRATRGEFTLDDHVTPWSTVARNLDVTVTKRLDYRGRASFSGGTIQFQSYEPMRADMQAEFKIEGSKVHFDRIDLQTTGARSALVGDVDLARWPEQLYQVRSRINFPSMREIFFSRQNFSLHGEGNFTGTFHLYKGGRELNGSFDSDLAGVNAYRFPALRGRLLWLPDRFEVTNASSRFYGGTTQFTYSMAPLGRRDRRPTARLDATYRDVDLVQFTDFLETRGLRLAGRATGQNLLEWTLGRFADHRGRGRVVVAPPPGARILGAGFTASDLPSQELVPSLPAPFDPHPRLGHLPIGGELEYTFGPEWIDIGPSRVATEKTYVEFEGRTAYGDRSRIPFHVTSSDWQESDQVLVGVMTAFGASARVVPVGGHGEFDGVMLNSFTRPRIEGTFTGDRLRAWDVVWGAGRGQVVIENGYTNVLQAVVSRDRSEVHVTGRFSLGYPRRDRGEELDARVRVVRRPVADLRHAFELDDYRVEGELSGEFHLYGKYERPFGFGKLTIENGWAYGERFESGSADLRFEGQGLRLDGIRIQKGGGEVTGAAYVGWNGTYSFNADGRRIPMESLASAAYPRAPLSGLLVFAASGSGEFDSPRYEVRARIADLFIADEGIGQITSRINVRDRQLTMEVEAASPRLAVSGTGRVALTPTRDGDLTFRFSGTSLDPYVRAFEPRLSPFTTAVASGTIRITGELNDIGRVVVDGNVEELKLALFDYEVRNDGPIRLALDRQAVRLDRLRLAGEGTALDLSGVISLRDERIVLRAAGDANLGILQGFFRDIRSAGAATVVADIQGPLRTPVFAGNAAITNGRIRHFSLPHSLEAINGRIAFDAGGIRMEDVIARLGGGPVRIGGRIGLKGYAPTELNLTAAGNDMRLRYPEGFRSVIDADLALRGDFKNPLLTGTVNVVSAVWVRRFEAGPGLLELAGASTGRAAAPPPPPQTTTLPLSFDLRIVAPSTLRIENNTARIVSSAELTLRGTYDRPLLFGRADIERGEVFFEGNRYLVTRGSIDFTNPTRIEPFFDIEAETRVRVPGQIYRVVFHATGTAERFLPELSSDPPLATIDILALLFGDVRDPQASELRALRRPEQTETALIQARAARLLASPISTGVGRVVEQTFGVDTVQITPSLGDPSAQQSTRLTPGARLTIGKRISERIFLTFSRALAATAPDEIILLEYSHSDRLAWIVSQNEDRTYALDFRMRHTF